MKTVFMIIIAGLIFMSGYLVGKSKQQPQSEPAMWSLNKDEINRMLPPTKYHCSDCMETVVCQPGLCK